MKYIIMCGGQYPEWKTPKHLTVINGETIVERTIRLLREAGVTDIAVSSNLEGFEFLDVPILKHDNSFICGVPGNDWVDAFYPMDEPVCYVFGDVVFSPEAIQKIVNTQTDGIQFFASSASIPFDKRYIKIWAEPFAFKVVDTIGFRKAIELTKKFDKENKFYRRPVSWELWQVIKGTQLNEIVYNNYVIINDYTCDIDEESDIPKFEAILCNT